MRTKVAIGMCFALLWIGQLRATEPSFSELGFLQGFDSANNPMSMTDNGDAVLGWSISVDSARAPYLWQRGIGISPLSNLITGPIDDIAMSGDGASIFVAHGTTVSRWTQASGQTPLFDSPVPAYAVQLSGSSSDGRTLAGQLYSDGGPGMPARVRAFAWRDGTGLQIIDDGFVIRGVSPDGNFLAGHRVVDANNALNDAIRRSIVGVETVVTDDFPFADATALSQDGLAVIGTSHSSGFYWTSTSLETPIGMLPMQSDATSPLDISSDGSIVVGYAEGAPQGAFIWDASNGIRSIYQILLDEGVDVSQYTLGPARFVSAGGDTIVGTAPNGIGGEYAWVATIVPEPSAIMLAASLGIILLPVAWRWSRRGSR